MKGCSKCLCPVCMFIQLTPKLSEELVVKCEEVQKSLDNKSMKEFKGLDRRLAGLEQLMMQMREIVRHQSDMAQVCQTHV